MLLRGIYRAIMTREGGRKELPALLGADRSQESAKSSGKAYVTASGK